MTKVYRVSGAEVEEWDVIRAMAKTAEVQHVIHGFAWKRTVRTSLLDHLGSEWFTTPEAALQDAIERLGKKIEFTKQRLQNERTVLGMLQGELRKRRKQPPSTNAVDPSAQHRESGPRAPSSLSVSTSATTAAPTEE